MNQESRHFFVQPAMGRPRLASRGFDSDHHIAEKLPALGVADLSECTNRTRPEQAGVEPGELSRSRRQRESNRHSSSESVT